MVSAVVRAAGHRRGQDQMLGQPHRFEAEFLGTDREVRHEPGAPTERDSDLHSADVTQRPAASEVLLLPGRA